MIKTEQSSYRLRSCVWEITLKCCFNCAYCGSKAGTARENELTTDECIDIASQLSDLGCRRVSLIGGEVFMRPDWGVIVRALTSRGIKAAIITNGFLFSEDIIDELKQSGIESVAVSLDGPEEIHDAFRQKGSFERGLRAIRVLTENGIHVSVITTLHSRNAGRLKEMYEILRNTGIFAWQIQACSPMGNAAKGSLSTEIDFNEVIRFVEEHIRKADFRIGIADNIGYYTESEGYLRGNYSGYAVFRGCGAGLRSIGIDSIGNVRGCESMYDDYFIEGNLREKSLAEIWNDPDAFSYNRNFNTDLLTGHCKTCPHNYRCAGGCRSYNYFTHGKLYESLRCARITANGESVL